MTAKPTPLQALARSPSPLPRAGEGSATDAAVEIVSRIHREVRDEIMRLHALRLGLESDLVRLKQLGGET